MPKIAIVQRSPAFLDRAACLVKAHRELDRAVDAAYLARLPPGMTAKPKLDTDGRRVAFLFTLYAALTNLAAVQG